MTVPIIAINNPTKGNWLNKGSSLATKKTPAATIVAAWIRADMGVGPSIASGNQTCNGNCADLAIGPIKTSMQRVKAAHIGTFPEPTATDKPSAMP